MEKQATCAGTNAGATCSMDFGAAAAATGLVVMTAKLKEPSRLTAALRGNGCERTTKSEPRHFFYKTNDGQVQHYGVSNKIF